MLGAKVHLTLLQCGLGMFCGGLVGFTLGLFGGGGSILAVPLMAYVVGVPNPHVAIGTSAFAVATNAAANLVNHARLGTVKWRHALVFSAAGVIGAFAGSSAGKALNGKHLLFLFAILMIVVGVLMLRRRNDNGRGNPNLTRATVFRLAGAGLLTGALSGFFGIGGGFLIVPALIAATGMPILSAVGSSLMAVTAFGLTTAVNYAFAGLVDWPLAAVFLAGGVGGGLLGAGAASHLSVKKGVLNRFFAALIFAVALYMIYRSSIGH